MNNKLTQDQVDTRLVMYDRVTQLLCAWAEGGPGSDQAAAVLKEVRGNRDRFIKRMEAGKVGRKPAIEQKSGNDFNYDNWSDEGNWEGEE